MSDRYNVPLQISVLPSKSPRQFSIQSNFRHAAGDWDDIYIDISGYFGKFSPHTFAAAPELYEALREAKLALDGLSKGEGTLTPIEKTIRRSEAALAKARGAS